MKIYDCFPYWREYQHIQARKELWAGSPFDVEMIAMVGSHTHAGVSISLSDPVRDGVEPGVTSLYVDLGMTGASGWDREFAHREALRAAMLDRCGPEDLIISVDADEIVDPSMAPAILRYCENHGVVSLSMLLLYYGLDWVASNTWVHPKAFLGKNVPSDLSAIRNDFARVAVPGSGWHVSWHGGADSRSSKAMSFSHSEFANNEGISAIERGAKFGYDPHGNKLLEMDVKALPQALITHLC